MAAIVRIAGHRTSALAGLALAASLVLTSAGCVTVSLPTGWFHDSAADERPCRILGYWDRNIRVAFDTESKTPGSQSSQVACLAGRVYFFGAHEGELITPRGKLHVAWFDMTGPPGTEPPLLGEVVYDPDSLQRMKSRNLIGMGYTIVAPWQGYTPNKSHIKVQVAFVPEKGGSPIYAEPALVSLQCDEPVVTSRGSWMPGMPTPLPQKQ
jgi:hypothetical protein